MSFFMYSQNNTGGSFEGDYEYIIVEADNAADADERAQTVGIYFDGCDKDIDCDCCGDRWYRAGGKGDPEPMIYKEPLREAKASHYRKVAGLLLKDATTIVGVKLK